MEEEIESLKEKINELEEEITELKEKISDWLKAAKDARGYIDDVVYALK